MNELERFHFLDEQVISPLHRSLLPEYPGSQAPSNSSSLSKRRKDAQLKAAIASLHAKQLAEQVRRESSQIDSRIALCELKNISDYHLLNSSLSSQASLLSGQRLLRDFETKYTIRQHSLTQIGWPTYFELTSMVKLRRQLKV